MAIRVLTWAGNPLVHTFSRSQLWVTYTKSRTLLIRSRTLVFLFTNPEKGRIKKHISGRGNLILARAVKKYGRDAFTHEILEENVFDEFLSELEKAYIAKFNTIRPNGYNITSGGGGILGYKHTPETKQRISNTSKGRPSWNKGKKLAKV